ncbi:MAG: UDP-N-acetylglucosamine 2-epimerase (non-hydrolyzing) [Chloroflexi bacterium]|nr:UDP-N-acetylglucosamine 2-epimerase (non-hydrolyzing) [Chloroflexota bacterium]
MNASDGKLKVLSCFGTRPEAIKMAPVVKELGRRPEFTSRVAVTAQHREMLDQVLDLFEIQPDHDLNIMTSGQTLFDVTTRALTGLGPIFEEEAPDVVLVQGDTTTTFVAGLAAFYLEIPVGHIEAGLRTYDKHHPFPEEINRRLTTALSDFHFAPTETSRQNLLVEGIPEDRVYVTGNTVIDALLSVVREDYRFESEHLNEVLLNERPVILVTAHRRENWGEPLEDICRAIKRLSDTNEVEVVFSVHRNPRVREAVGKILKGSDRIHLIEPLDYEPFVQLINKSHLILTDSGGIQEEAPSLGKPVLVLREVTERPEGVAAGTVRVVGRETDRIIAEAARLLTDSGAYNKMARAVNPYGDGHASERIADILLQQLAVGKSLEGRL